MTNDTEATEAQEEVFTQFEQLVTQLSTMKNQITNIQQNIKHL